MKSALPPVIFTPLLPYIGEEKTRKSSIPLVEHITILITA